MYTYDHIYSVVLFFTDPTFAFIYVDESAVCLSSVCGRTAVAGYGNCAVSTQYGIMTKELFICEIRINKANSDSRMTSLEVIMPLKGKKKRKNNNEDFVKLHTILLIHMYVLAQRLGPSDISLRHSFWMYLTLIGHQSVNGAALESWLFLMDCELRCQFINYYDIL